MTWKWIHKGGVIHAGFLKFNNLYKMKLWQCSLFPQVDPTSATIMDIGCPLAQWWLSYEDKGRVELRM